jgi:hypothetical protein
VSSNTGRLSTLLFDMQGVVPIGYTLFAVALGIFAGTIWHTVLPAMAATLVGFLGIRIALPTLTRPRYLPARVLTFPVQGATAQPNMTLGDWVVSAAVRDASGKVVQANAEVACPPGAGGLGGGPCGARLGLGPGSYNWVLYQPADRFWAFQGVETGIFVALALLLLYLAIRRIRRIA